MSQSLQQQQVGFLLPLIFSEAVIRVSVSAVQLFMWLYMMSHYLGAPIKTRTQRMPYIMSSLIILALTSASSVLWALGTYNMIFEAQPGIDKLEAALNVITKYEVSLLAVSSFLADLSFRVSDIVLMYRCYIIWFEQRWIIIFPILVFFASTGINWRTYIPFGSFYDPKLNAADVFLLVGLNVMLTLLMSFRLIQAQRRFTSVLPNSDHRVYLGIVNILIESAAPVAISGVALTISRFWIGVTWSGSKAANILQVLFVTAATLAPQFIIFRVTTGRSWADKTDTSAILSRPIEFIEPAQSTSSAENSVIESSV